MNQSARKAELENLRTNDTSKLIELFKSTTGDSETQAAIVSALERRQQRFPDSTAVRAPKRSPLEECRIGIPSNAIVSHFGAEMMEVQFPKDGYLQCARSEFKSIDDLIGYLSEVFSLGDHKDSIRMSARRRGKYVRVDRTGRRVFTFGEPVLDVISDEHGWLSIGNETFDLRRFELESSQERKGGISTIDLSLNDDEMRRADFAHAVSGAGSRTLIEHNASRSITASTNPSTVNFSMGGARMRFRSWRKNYVVYKSIGTEIETWGRDFTFASIESIYADPISANPGVCAIVKRDSDSDTNDDYVDEYEYAINAPLSSTVRSYRQAQWQGQYFDGTVSKGSCQIFL